MKKPVFFSGGTALYGLARAFASLDRPVTYIITTFDSGGSTQALRKVLPIPAVGDLRNRLLAGVNPDSSLEPTRLYLKSRLGLRQSFADARKELVRASRSQPPEGCEHWESISLDLEYFLTHVPAGFDARGASMGNIALAGNWLANGGSLQAAVDKYTALLGVKARLAPVCEKNLHLAVRLANGAVFIGQHFLHDAQPAPVADVWLVDSSPWQACPAAREVRPAAASEAIQALAAADIICFPMGSFFSSLLATLLPCGLGKAVAASRALKVFIPNTGTDGELAGLDLATQVRQLILALKRDAPEAKIGDLLNIVLLDSVNGRYQVGSYSEFASFLSREGVEILDKRIVSDDNLHDAHALLEALDSL